MSQETGEQASAVAQTKSDPIRLTKDHYSAKERWLLLVAVALAVLLDRTLFHVDTESGEAGMLIARYLGGAALALLGAYVALNWKNLRWDGIAWALLGSTAALCAWMILFGGGGWTMFSLIALLASEMLYMQYARSSLSPKRAAHFFLQTVRGYFVQPFRGIPHCFGAMFSGNRIDRKILLRVLAGVALAALLVCAAMPLLMSADSVFSHMLIGTRLDGGTVGHAIGTAILALLIYSFLWCMMELPESTLHIFEEKPVFDPLVCGIGLGALLLVYGLFAGVQFVYLFAHAGLPLQLTYAEYARQGFAEMMCVTALNLALFGLFLECVPRGKVFVGLLMGLLAASALMVASGIVRLNLYLSAYGMTEPRLLAYWGLLLCGMAIGVCAVRLVKERVPAVAVLMVAGLVWYCVLAYANPERIIETYNQTHVTLHQQIVEEETRVEGVIGGR